MVTLTTKKVNLEAIAIKVAKILDGNKKGDWSSQIEVLNSDRVTLGHPEGYGLVFGLKRTNGNILKIEIRPTITFLDKSIWERLTKVERENLHPSLSLIVQSSTTPQEIADKVTKKILARYVKYFNLGKERILREEREILKIKTNIIECSGIIGGKLQGRGFLGHTKKGHFIIGVPAEKQGCMTLKIEDIEPEKAKAILKMLVSEN